MKINYKKWGIILGIITVLIVSANIILSSLISEIVTNQLEKISEKRNIQLEVDRVNINIFSSRLNIKGIKIKPDSLYFEKFKLGETKRSTEATFELSKLRIKGFNIFKILLFKEVNLKKLEAKGIDLVVYKSNKYIKEKDENETKEDIKLDSILIEGINDIGLGELWIDELDLKIIDVQSNDTLFVYTENECSITGIDIKPYESTEGLFKIGSNNFNINLKKQHFDLKTGHYSLLFDEINFNYEQGEIKINNFSLKPTMDKAKLASTFKFNKEVFNVDVKSIKLVGLDLDEIVKTGIVDLDSVVVDELEISIYKDQTKPFDLNKRPKFLNQKIRNLKTPINLDAFVVNNSHFLYEERHAGSTSLMTIEIDDLETVISNITSIEENFKTTEPLTHNLKGKLNGVAPLDLSIYMPYTSRNYAYSITGEVGSAKFKDFNSAIYPALGAKIQGGQIDHISFFVNGTPYKTNGKMTMLYHDLSANFFKSKPKHKGKKSKTLSWFANSVVTTQNPTKKGRTLVSLIEFERIPYKGFGNLIWKSFMSGLVNTVSPVGKVVKETKREKEVRRGKYKN